MAKEKIDEGLIGNEKIEQAIAGLQQEATPAVSPYTDGNPPADAGRRSGDCGSGTTEGWKTDAATGD